MQHLSLKYRHRICWQLRRLYPREITSNVDQSLAVVCITCQQHKQCSAQLSAGGLKRNYIVSTLISNKRGGGNKQGGGAKVVDH